MSSVDNISNTSINNILMFLPFFRNINESFYKVDKKDLFYPYSYNSEVTKFIATLKKEEFTIVFDWPEWQGEADKYFKEPELINSADIITLRKLMTMFIRKERFCSGFIKSVIDTGMILRILERLEAIRTENSINH